MAPRRTYKWYTGKPIFEFGHGLHYTTFNVSVGRSLPTNFTTSALTSGQTAPYADLLPLASVPVVVKNTGKVKSDFVVLGFLKTDSGPKPAPVKSLVGFTRLHAIEPGMSANGTIEVSLGAVARSDEKGDLVLWPGEYSLVLDVDEKSTWNFTIGGDAKTLDVLPPKQ